MSITDYKLQINALELLKWLIIAILAVLIVFLPSISYLNFCLIILALLIVSYRRPILMFGLAILLYPFNQNYWQVGWELNIPYADLIIIIVGIVWFWQQIIYLWQEKKIQISQQAKINLVCLLLLVLTGSLSLLNIWPEQLAESLKYFWRFGIFYFLLYYFLTQELLKKANKLWAAVWCMSAVGLFLSIMGVLSLLWPEIRHVIPMATPLSWWGLFPFGASHNLLAESLLAIFPLTWLLAYKYQEESFSRWLYLTVALMIGIILLTFSRAGWLTLALELLILGIGYYQRKIRSVILQYWWILIIALIPLFIYLLTFGQTDFVLSSNAAFIDDGKSLVNVSGSPFGRNWYWHLASDCQSRSVFYYGVWSASRATWLYIKDSPGTGDYWFVSLVWYLTIYYWYDIDNLSFAE